MFGFFKKTKTTYTVEKLHDGRFGIVQRTGNNALLVGDYTRKRDAIRGATRRGFTIEGTRD